MHEQQQEGIIEPIPQQPTGEVTYDIPRQAVSKQASQYWTAERTTHQSTTKKKKSWAWPKIDDTMTIKFYRCTQVMELLTKRKISQQLMKCAICLDGNLQFQQQTMSQQCIVAWDVSRWYQASMDIMDQNARRDELHICTTKCYDRGHRGGGVHPLSC